MRAVDIKDFILGFVRSGNAEEAAIGAGIDPERAKRDGLRLLSKKAVRRQIDRQRSENCASGSDIRAGLERLAYGRVNDAAALAFAEEVTPEQIAKADLYNISEIKKVKGGGVEIKFFDRQKALERLFELDASESGDKKARDLLGLIYGGEGEADE